jgi:hypothetical protein
VGFLVKYTNNGVQCSDETHTFNALSTVVAGKRFPKGVFKPALAFVVGRGFSSPESEPNYMWHCHDEKLN